MACGVGFIAQATDTPLSLSQQLALIAVMLLTSKGGAGAAGGALVKLAATLQSSHALPLSGVGLLFGIDRVLAIATSTTNVIGNSVAVLVLSKWGRMFDQQKFDAYVNGRRAPRAESATGRPNERRSGETCSGPPESFLKQHGEPGLWG